MMYEHKAMISNSISKNKDYFFTTTAKDMKNELEEVYRKAKAWDELKEEMRSMFVWGYDLPKGTPSKYMNESMYCNISIVISKNPFSQSPLDTSAL